MCVHFLWYTRNVCVCALCVCSLRKVCVFAVGVRRWQNVRVFAVDVCSLTVWMFKTCVSTVCITHRGCKMYVFLVLRTCMLNCVTFKTGVFLRMCALLCNIYAFFSKYVYSAICVCRLGNTCTHTCVFERYVRDAHAAHIH